MHDLERRSLVEGLANQEAELGEEAFSVLRELHSTLNTTSGVMAAGIILSGGERSDLGWPMVAALLCFVLALAVGLVFLRSIYGAFQRSRGELRSQVANLLGYRKEAPKKKNRIEDFLGQHSVRTSVVTEVSRKAQVGLVFVGFALVLWSLGAELLSQT